MYYGTSVYVKLYICENSLVTRGQELLEVFHVLNYNVEKKVSK